MPHSIDRVTRAVLASLLAIPVMGSGWPQGGLVTLSRFCTDHIVIATPDGDALARVVGGQFPKGGDELDGDFHHPG